MEPDTPRRRGRPSRPAGNPMGHYMRTLREARQWTVRELARAVGLPESSASYISQLEAGLKVPNPELAHALAERLRDERGIFRLWAMTARRGDPQESAVALRQLARILDDPSIANDPHFTHPTRTRIEQARESLMQRRGIAMRTSFDTERSPSFRRSDVDAERTSFDEPAMVSAFRLRERDTDRGDYTVPLLPEGADPGRESDTEGFAQGGRFDHVRLEHRAARALNLYLPFAYRLSERGVQRVSSLMQPGDIAVISRDQGPIMEHEVYAVRLSAEGGVVLALVMWNGYQLLLLPAEGNSDFMVLNVKEAARLPEYIVGHVATVIRERERG